MKPVASLPRCLVALSRFAGDVFFFVPWLALQAYLAVRLRRARPRGPRKASV